MTCKYTAMALGIIRLHVQKNTRRDGEGTVGALHWAISFGALRRGWCFVSHLVPHRAHVERYSQSIPLRLGAVAVTSPLLGQRSFIFNEYTKFKKTKAYHLKEYSTMSTKCLLHRRVSVSGAIAFNSTSTLVSPTFMGCNRASRILSQFL